MNTEVIERRWARLTDAMGDGARSLAVPFLGLPIGPALGMIARPETFSPLEMRVIAITYLTILACFMTMATIKYWHHPDPLNARRMLALATERVTEAVAIHEKAVALHGATAALLRSAPAPSTTPDETS